MRASIKGSMARSLGVRGRKWLVLWIAGFPAAMVIARVVFAGSWGGSVRYAVLGEIAATIVIALPSKLR